MKLASILPPEAVFARLAARDKKQALKSLSLHAAQSTGLSEREIYNVLIAREQVGCTGMGKGVCIPHGRFENLKTLHALFARLEAPISFGAADNRPVDLLFVLLTPVSANTEHLKALATISRLLRDKTLVENLRAAPDANVIHTLLISAANDE